VSNRNITERQAVLRERAAIDEAVEWMFREARRHGIESVDGRRLAEHLRPLPKAPSEAPLCACGCGQRKTSKKGLYRRGHERRVVSPRGRQLRTYRGRPITQEGEVARFWESVAKAEGCWEWTALLKRNGYGSFYRNRGVKVAAHRYSWELHHGPVPDGLFVCHRCDNPKCVRPDHLFLGTHRDNMDDMWAKGRANRAGGSLPHTHCAKGHALTPENRSPSYSGCVTCRRESSRTYYLQKKATRAALAPRRAVSA
jgi:hypothetical protein